MLSHESLTTLKAEFAAFKDAVRNGIYVTSPSSGTATCRLDYRLKVWRETPEVRYCGTNDGISSQMTREYFSEACMAIGRAISHSPERRREKHRRTEATTFDSIVNKGLEEARVAEITRSICKGIVERDTMPVLCSGTLVKSARNVCAFCVQMPSVGARKPAPFTCETPPIRSIVSSPRMATRRSIQPTKLSSPRSPHPPPLT